jgi:hypothetical protein
MILLKSLIILLLLLIIAHFIKVGWGNKRDGREGFQELAEINSYFNPNIANDLESKNLPDEIVLPRTVELGGELAPPIGPHNLSAAQKAQKEALTQQSEEEENTVGEHKKASDNALQMNYLKGQMDELVKLGNEAQVINENFRSI